MFSWGANRRENETSTSTPTTTTATAIQGSIRPPDYTRQQHLDSYLNDEMLKRSTRRVSTGMLLAFSLLCRRFHPSRVGTYGSHNIPLTSFCIDASLPPSSCNSCCNTMTRFQPNDNHVLLNRWFDVWYSLSNSHTSYFDFARPLSSLGPSVGSTVTTSGHDLGWRQGAACLARY